MTDFEKFESQFFSEEKEILVLIAQSTSGAMKYGEMWRPSNHPMAFIDLQNNTLYGKCRLEWLVESENWKYYFEPRVAYRLKVKEIKPTETPNIIPTFMLVEVLEENVSNEKFTEILKEFDREVIYEDERFRMKLDKIYACFEGEEIGKTHSFSVETEELEELKILLKKYQSLTQNYDQWLINIKEFACEKLLKLANDWAKQENENAQNITSQTFTEKINLVSVALDEDENLTLYFDDGDLFWGHSICVYGKLDGSLQDATIEG